MYIINLCISVDKFSITLRIEQRLINLIRTLSLTFPQIYRRPDPKSAQDIGSWGNILRVRIFSINYLLCKEGRHFSRVVILLYDNKRRLMALHVSGCDGHGNIFQPGPHSVHRKYIHQLHVDPTVSIGIKVLLGWGLIV